jgi:hypothetical protein
MSFFNSRGGSAIPGVIDGNALSGLRHRVAVCVERVLDACTRQETAENTKLHLSNIKPKGATPPYKFISAHSMQPAACIKDLTIDRQQQRQEFARVRCMVVIPICVTFEDSKGDRCSAESKISVPIDVIMYVPRDSIFPFEVKAVASVNCPSGREAGDGAFLVTACIMIVLKITADTDLLLPTYGFCAAPPAVNFETRECDEFFDLPLYPSGRQV